jgi:predicted amidohydrolase
MTSLRVAAIQHDIVWNDRDANFERLAPMIGNAAVAGARLVILSETFSTGFGFGIAGFRAEPFGGASSQFLTAQAQTHGVWVGGSCPEIDPHAPVDDQRPSNCFVIAGPDGTQHRYRKVHPFSHSGENLHVRPGDELVTVDIEGLRVSMFVCYDLRFANEFWELAPTTDVYLVAAHWPERRREHWIALLHARAIENQAYVVGVNRVGQAPGEEGTLVYSGDSRIVDPLGRVVASASCVETMLLADVSSSVVATTRSTYRFLDDRRAESTVQRPGQLGSTTLPT